MKWNNISEAERPKLSDREPRILENTPDASERVRSGDWLGSVRKVWNQYPMNYPLGSIILMGLFVATTMTTGLSQGILAISLLIWVWIWVILPLFRSNHIPDNTAD